MDLHRQRHVHVLGKNLNHNNWNYLYIS
jgi:hypothetical protein